VLLAYKAFAGNMPGRTLLQKRLYFLSVLLKQDLGYDAHYYGPYSAEVANSNLELKSIGFVSEQTTVYGKNEQGFEKVRYEYSFSNLGQRVADKLALEYPDLWNQIHTAAKVVDSGGNLNYMELSIAAKAYYVLTQRLNGKGSLKEIEEILQQFGWLVTEDQLSNAASFLKKANLVTQS
jgi:hypothetical protein